MSIQIEYFLVIYAQHPLVMEEHFRRETLDDPIMHQGLEGGDPCRGIPVQASLYEIEEAILRALHQLGKRLCPWDAQLAPRVRT